MRSSALLTAALAAGSIAFPLEGLFKRDYVTEYTYVTVTSYVTAGAAATSTSATSTTTTAGPLLYLFGNRNRSSSSSTATTTTATAVAAASTTRAVQSSATQAAAPSSSARASSSSTRRTSTSTATSTPSQAPAPAASAASSGLNTYQVGVLNHHNPHRANHSAVALTWDNNLAAAALQAAQTCVFEHNRSFGDGNYGQNLIAGAKESDAPSAMTAQWYNNEMMNFQPFYGQATPSDMSDASFDGFGHFTQVVWQGTTKIGCATVDCTGSGKGVKGLGGAGITSNVAPFFTVCNYGPAGNIIDYFGKNVQRPLGQPGIK